MDPVEKNFCTLIPSTYWSKIYIIVSYSLINLNRILLVQVCILAISSVYNIISFNDALIEYKFNNFYYYYEYL